MTLIDASALALSAPVNLRDLGGIRIEGGSVRPGFAIRADDLSIADADSARRLVDEGLTTIIDLRSKDEVGITGRGPFADLHVTYHHVPFIADVGAATLAEDGQSFDQPTFESMYVRMFENAAAQIVSALAIIAHAPGATAFHCAAGQDRTGVLAASLLMTLGAQPDDIVSDYAVTGRNSTAIMSRIHPVIGPLMARLGIDLDAAARAATRTEFSPAPMRGLLTHLTTTYTDPLRPLRETGLTDGLVRRLRERALLAG